MRTVFLATSWRNRQTGLFYGLQAVLLLVLFLPVMDFAHRGVPDEIDACRIKVGYEKIHFTAYTPQFSGSKGYCQFIPDVGLTNLVFDYEGKKLRDVTIEFEITKEPGGERVFYQEPQKIKSGTVNAAVDFARFGKGDYLAHVTIVHKGDKLDSHLPFGIGIEEETTHWALYFFLVVSVLLFALFRKLVRENPVKRQDPDAD